MHFFFMLIGLLIKMISLLQVLTLSKLATILSYEVPRSKELLHALLLKRNTILLLVHLQDYTEYVQFLLNLVFMFHKYL